MKRIMQFDGLYGETNDPAGQTTSQEEYLFSERLETRSRTFEWVIYPHVHTRLFQVFFVETGEVTFSEARQQRRLTAPVLLLIPSLALHGFVFTPDIRGRILTLSNTLLTSLFPPSSILTPMLESVQCIQTFDTHPAPVVSQLMAEIDDELFSDQPATRQMLPIALQRLFIVTYRLWTAHNTDQPEPNNVNMRYFSQFQHRVRQADSLLTINGLASELAITPVHLNRVCQAVAGKSASYLVQEHILSKARNYLTHTTYSVSEIAYLLHFGYPNYFARFFRKHTGLSPTEFRETVTNR